MPITQATAALRTVVFGACFVALSACAAQDGATPAASTTPAATHETMHHHDHAAAAQGTAEAQPVWIDVRTPDEYSAGHLDGAHNIPVEDIGARISALVPNRDTPVLLYCKSGRRAERARQVLLNEGYTHVENRGGYADVIEAQNGQ